MRSLQSFAAALAVGVCCLAPPAGAQTAVSFAWVQFEADGQAHARAIVPGACPALVAGGQTVPMTLRAGPGAGFADTVCDALLPPGASGAHVGAIPLPAVPQAPQRIAVFGDSGCRLKGAEVQACNDPAAWPLPAIARAMAAERPDLVIHVGDYYYRETPCPSTTNCANSPYGDNSNSWVADYFTPVAPLFAVAPIVTVRGNHEDCKRAPLGWARYLSSTATVQCIAHEPVAYVTFDNLLLGDVDDSAEVTETLTDPAVFTADERAVDAQALAQHRETWLLAHRPPVAYLAAHAAGDPAGPDVAAILSGHIHTFGAYSFAGAAPQLIVGTGGDNLAPADEIASLDVLHGLTDTRFGYALFERNGGGWDIAVHGTDGNVHRRCRLESRTVRCGPAITP